MIAATDWPSLFGGAKNLIKGVCAISGLYDLKPVKSSHIQKILYFTDAKVLESSSILLDCVPQTLVIVGVGKNYRNEFNRQSKDLVDNLIFKMRIVN